MPVRRATERETASQKAMDYSDAVIVFMENRGYFLESRAEDSGEHEDLIFLPKAGNRTGIVAEAKYRSEENGLSPNDYVGDFAKRFYQWEEGAYREYNFQLFTSKLSYDQLWDDLFTRLDEDELDNFYGKMQDEANEYEPFLAKHDYTRFARFAENTVIWGNYEINDLIRIHERIQDTGEYDYNPHTVDYEPLPEPGSLDTNLLEITHLPETLFTIPAVDGLSTHQFYSHSPHRRQPVYFYENTIYSLLHPENLDDATTEMCNVDEVTTQRFADVASQNPSETEVNISKTLLKRLIMNFAERVGAVVNQERGPPRIYMQHDDENVSIDNKWMTKELETGEIRHRSVTVFVRYFGGSYYIGFYPTIEYTKDGEELVDGGRKKYLMEKFPPGRFPQNSRKKQTVNVWTSELALQQSLARFQLSENLQTMKATQVDELTLESGRPPQSGTERDELIENTLTEDSTMGAE